MTREQILRKVESLLLLQQDTLNFLKKRHQNLKLSENVNIRQTARR